MGISGHNQDRHCQSGHIGRADRSTRRNDDRAMSTSEVYSALRRFQQYQFNNYSCSVATVAMLVNAARCLMNNGAKHRVIHQEEILKRVTLDHWAERVSAAGYKGRHGLPFDHFGRVVKASFNAFDIPYFTIEAVATPPQAADKKTHWSRLLAALESMAHSDRELIGAYFTQGAFIGQWHGHHVSPVGAYNAADQRVLILDVDAEQFDPYWVPLERFYEGLLGQTNIYNNIGGGYVSIRL
jgi:hypothetical protein